ncbi:MAG: hypothetical protein JWP38_59 [Herbaspirillum sp.]|nr:hypothetical protein [Herbaspirillum sp.]
MNVDLKLTRRWMTPALLGLMALGWMPSASAQDKAAGAADHVDAGAAVSSRDGMVALTEQYPAGTIRTVDGANAALDAASKERARIDVELIRQQRICYGKFFVSSCLEKVNGAHRDQSKKIKSIEVEAKTTLRQVRADERDAALADQRAKDLADAPRRAEEQRQNALQNASKVEESARRTAEADARAKVPATSPDQRIAEHEQKVREARARQEAVAKNHAANVAAHDKKVKDAAARQKEVADKKAAKAAAAAQPPAAAPPPATRPAESAAPQK